MCLSLSYENKIYISRIKIRMSRALDKMNDTLVYAVEEFDKKYTEFGGIVVKKFNNILNSGNSRNYRYTRTNSSNVSPVSPFEIITTDSSGNQSYDTHNTVINVEEDISKTQLKTQSKFQQTIKTKELVEKHYIDNTESFLDDAWDIINGND